MTDQPIAWGMPRSDGTIIDVICPDKPLYAAPQPRKRLTEQEIDEVWNSLIATPDFSRVMIARAIEAAVWGDGK
jgi:hypothetical protein